MQVIFLLFEVHTNFDGICSNERVTVFARVQAALFFTRIYPAKLGCGL
jgi:hypothetical protein